jgi:Fe2+ or Zn2+ uptake regulation protein
MKQTQNVLEKLKGLGERLTHLRRAVIEILAKSTAPISTQEILEKLAQKKLTANKTTVYRQLATLAQQNLVREIRLSDRSVRYELGDDDDHHHHLVCTNCNRVEDISFEEDLARQEATIKRTKKFKVTHHALEFFGLCKKCQK